MLKGANMVEAQGVELLGLKLRNQSLKEPRLREAVHKCYAEVWFLIFGLSFLSFCLGLLSDLSILFWIL